MSEDVKEITPVDCDHIGHWVPAGMTPLNAADGSVYLAQIVVCSRCGINRIQLHHISPQAAEAPKPAIAVPKS